MPPDRQSASPRTIVTRAKEFIERHWRENLTLEQIAAQVFLSPFHFQRVFKQETGETPKEYLTRIRLEGAVQHVRIDLDMSVYEVGVECGFSSPAVFSRAFRKRFGVSPSVFRTLPISALAELSAWEPGIQKAFQHHLREPISEKEREQFCASVTLRHLEPVQVIYLPTTMTSEEQLGEGFQSLARLAAAYEPDADVTHPFGVMYDFPLHTPLEKCRYRACAVVPDGTAVHPKLHSMKIAGGTHAVFPLQGDIATFIERSIIFFNDWLPASHYRRAQHYLLERFTALPNPETYATLGRELLIPVQPV